MYRSVSLARVPSEVMVMVTMTRRRSSFEFLPVLPDARSVEGEMKARGRGFGEAN